MVATTVYSFSPTIPVGTTPAAPSVQSLSFPTFIVDKIEIRIPDGWNGLVGFQLASKGQQIIPYATGTFIVASGESLDWNLANLQTSGDWQLIAYNQGQWPHTPQIRFLVEPVVTAPPLAATAALNPLSLGS